MRNSRTLLVLVFLFAFSEISSAPTLFAQGAKGTIQGRIIDSAGAVLQGARILLEPGDFSSVSGSQGEFTITGVPARTYTVTISYVGLETFSGSVDAKAGTVTRIDQVLKVASQSQQVIVTAERAAGEAEAVNRERSADNIVQVLPADVIRSLPNANLADALGRLAQRHARTRRR